MHLAGTSDTTVVDTVSSDQRALSDDPRGAWGASTTLAGRFEHERRAAHTGTTGRGG